MRMTTELTSMIEALKGAPTTRDIQATRELGHHVRPRVTEMMMQDTSSKSMGEDKIVGEMGGK
jgi:hypothetical protein